MKKYFLFFIGLFFISCSDRVRFEEKNIQKQLGDCENTFCTILDFDYLYCNRGSESFVKNFNEKMTSEAVSFLYNYQGESLSNEKYETVEEAIKSYFEEFGGICETSSKSVSCELILVDSLCLNSPEVVCVKRDTYSYLGGAHPLYFTSYYNFETKNGKFLSPYELFTNKEEVIKVVEKFFREQNDMKPNESFSDGGFWIEEFVLPENIGFTKENMILFYNPYEIAPYSIGPITVNVPISEIKQWLIFFNE